MILFLFLSLISQSQTSVWFKLILNVASWRYRVFPSNWLLKNRPYSAMGQLIYITKIDLYTVFTPVLCSKAGNLSNMQLWPQFCYEFLLEMWQQKFDLFVRKVILCIWLKFYSLTVRIYNVILRKIYHFITMIFNEQQSKKLIFKKNSHQNIVFSINLSKNKSDVKTIYLEDF